MANSFKILLIIVLILRMQEGKAQKTFKASPLGLQLKEILDNGTTGYKKLKLGKGVPDTYDTIFNSAAKMANTLKSTILCSGDCSYKVLIGDELKEDAATTMFATWSNLLSEALGTDFLLERKTKTDDLFVSVEDHFKFEGAYNNTTGKKLRKLVTLQMYSYDRSPSTIEMNIRVSGF